MNLLPSWVASPEDGSRQLPKRSVVLKICDNGKSPCECWWHYSKGSAPQISKGTIWQNLKPITSPRILKTSFQKIQLNTELPPPLSQFYSRLPPSKRFLPWNSVYNLCTYRSYNGIIISSKFLFCHFSLERGIIQCLLVMLCNQILSSLSPSDKYDFVICARSWNYEFHRSVLQADKKNLGNPTSFYVFWFNDYTFLLISPLPISDKCVKHGRAFPCIKFLD
jgi:hypothetical protein